MIEYYGCYFHGCRKCFPELDLRYNYTMCRESLIRIAGFKFKSIWECESRLNMNEQQLLKHNSLIQKHNKMKKASEFPIANSLFGGRTENFYTYYFCKEDEEIKYVDFTSLYSWVLEYNKFPSGHPEVIFDEEYVKDKFFGFVACQILPPRLINIPVIKAQINCKLYFAFCRECATTQSTHCHHNGEERSFTKIWTFPEIDRAVDVGYKIIKTILIYHYAEKSGMNFRGYIDLFSKYKQEASGSPENLDLDTYINEYYAHEGILLDKNKIEHNNTLKVQST